MRPRDYVLFLSDLTGLAGFLVTLRSIDILDFDWLIRNNLKLACEYRKRENRNFHCNFWPLGSQQSFLVA